MTDRPRLQGPLCDMATRRGHCTDQSCGAIMASAGAARLTEDDVRWLARMNRVVHARHEALQRERLERPQEGEATRDGDHDAAARRDR